MASSADKKSAAVAAAIAHRGARRSLVKDLCNEHQHHQLQHHHHQQQQQHIHLPEAYTPRLFTKKQLLLLQQQQQRQYQFAEDAAHPKQQQQQQHINVLNSRRVYPSSRSHLLLRGDLSSDCSSHGSPLLPRSKVPKKMVVDEKQLAMKLLRARNALSSSTSSSSSSSENPSLRASAEVIEVAHRSSASELARRNFLAGCVTKAQSGGVIHRFRENDASASADEKKVACVVTAVGSSGRSSDAEESFRPRKMIPGVPMLLRSASCSSAASTVSGLKKMVRLKASDMAAGMQEHAFFCANEVLEAMDKLHCKRVAWVLKKEFDKAYGPAWHCVVGTSFGSYVTHSVGGFLYFSIGKVSVLLFQTAVELIEHH